MIFDKMCLPCLRRKDSTQETFPLLARAAQVSSDKVFDDLEGCHPDGLTFDEAAQRLTRHGPNTYSAECPPSCLVTFFYAAVNPFNLLLAALIIFNGAISQGDPDWPSLGIMITMICLSTTLRFVQEHRAIVAIHKLSRMTVHEVKVKRRDSNKLETIPAAKVVPGDIIELHAGDVCPADCVVLSSTVFTVNQAFITGEIHSINKEPKVVSSHDLVKDLLGAENICLASSSVCTGYAQVIAVATGEQAYIAAQANVLNKRKPTNSFERGIRMFSYMLIGAGVTLVVIVLVVKGTKEPHDWYGAAFFSMAAALGIVPQMLPAIIALNLAKSAMTMSKKKMHVKRISAVQAMGSATVICSDKTGTLTSNVITINSVLDHEGNPSTEVLELAYLNAALQSNTRNVLDKAIIDHCQTDTSLEGERVERMKTLLASSEKLVELPFDSDRRLLSVLVRKQGNKCVLITKGALEEVLQCSATIGSNMEPLSHRHRVRVYKLVQQWQSEGQRILCVATKEYHYVNDKLHNAHRPLPSERGMNFIGFLTFSDPVKDTAIEAIVELQSLHVRVKILTGDSAETSEKVAHDIGLLGGHIMSDDKEADTELALAKSPSYPDGETQARSCITGPELALLLGKDFDAVVRDCVIFSRLMPHQKSQIVKSLQRQNEVVAFLGDGVNDVMALHQADVGISVDDAVSIAKSAADLVLGDKSLSAIAQACRAGRIGLGNTKKYLLIAISGNLGNAISITASSVWLDYDPIKPLMTLVLNLMNDLSQATISWDHMDEGWDAHPHQWHMAGVVKFMLFFGLVSPPFDILTFVINQYVYGTTSADPRAVAVAQTRWYILSLATQTSSAIALRTPKIPLFQSRPSWPFATALLGLTVIGIVLVYIPQLNSGIGFVEPEDSWYGYVAAFVVSYQVLIQFAKLAYIWIFGHYY